MHKFQSQWPSWNWTHGKPSIKNLSPLMKTSNTQRSWTASDKKDTTALNANKVTSQPRTSAWQLTPTVAHTNSPQESAHLAFMGTSWKRVIALEYQIFAKDMTWRMETVSDARINIWESEMESASIPIVKHRMESFAQAVFQGSNTIQTLKYANYLTLIALASRTMHAIIARSDFIQTQRNYVGSCLRIVCSVM